MGASTTAAYLVFATTGADRVAGAVPPEANTATVPSCAPLRVWTRRSTAFNRFFFGSPNRPAASKVFCSPAANDVENIGLGLSPVAVRIVSAVP